MPNLDNILDTIDSDQQSYDSLENQRDGSMDIYSPFDVDAEELSRDQSQWENFIRQINNLSQAMQNILFDASTAYTIEAIASEFNLNEEQIKNLSRVVRNIILGDLSLKEVASNIATHLNLPLEEASKISDSLASELFQIQGNVSANRSINQKVTLPDVNENNIVDLRKRTQ